MTSSAAHCLSCPLRCSPCSSVARCIAPLLVLLHACVALCPACRHLQATTVHMHAPRASPAAGPDAGGLDGVSAQEHLGLRHLALLLWCASQCRLASCDACRRACVGRHMPAFASLHGACAPCRLETPSRLGPGKHQLCWQHSPPCPGAPTPLQATGWATASPACSTSMPARVSCWACCLPPGAALRRLLRRSAADVPAAEAKCC